MLAVLLLPIAAAALVGGCARRLGGSGVETTGANADARLDTTAQERPRIELDAGVPPLVDAGPLIPTADPDAGGCRRPSGDFPQIVCFGSDPAPYQQYLELRDGGPAPGQCPTMRDFMHLGGELCGFVACGPLLGSAVSELPDASAVIGDAGDACCFYVADVCGV